MSNRIFSSEKSPWYNKPYSLELKKWAAWEKETKANYPIQFWFRETVPLWWGCHVYRFKELYWKVRHFFMPCHAEIRKAVPRGWTDVSNLILELNFAMITSFKKEADESWVDWDEENQKPFKVWLDSAAEYVKTERPALLKEQDAAYPEFDLFDQDNKTYEELYGRVNELEKIITDKDNAILKQMIDYREYFWT